MGQRFTITESERNRIKGLYEETKPVPSVKPKGVNIPLIQIKVGPTMCDLGMIQKLSRGASFYGKNRGDGSFFEVFFTCGSPKVTLIQVLPRETTFDLKDYIVSPQAYELLKKSAGCDSYVKNQEAPSDMKPSSDMV